jgi:hypothetical protein
MIIPIPGCKDPAGFELCMLAGLGAIQNPKHLVHEGLLVTFNCWIGFCRVAPKS